MLQTLSQLRTPVKLLLAVAIVGLIYGAARLFSGGEIETATPDTDSSSSFVDRLTNAISGDDPLTLCVNTWGGFAGAQYMNGGFEPNDNSRLTREHNVRVRFIKMDDFDASRAAFASGACDFLWGTIDAFVTEAEALSAQGVRVPFQIDWSRGGDAVVCVRDIRSVNALRGRSVGVAFGTPSHSLLLWLLNSSGLDFKDLEGGKPVQQRDEPAVVAAFKAGAIDCGIVWSPDDADLVATVPGAHVLTSTKQATDLIADTMLVKAETLADRRDDVRRLYEGWMVGNDAVTNDPKAFAEAVRITAAGYQMPAEFMQQAIRNVRLVTHGDNLNFFGLTQGYNGMKADELYTRTGMLYQETGFVQGFPSWRNVVDTSIVASAKPTGNQQAENAVAFKPATPAIVAAEAVASKPVTVTFALNSSVLDDKNKSIIDRQVLSMAKQFRTSYIRIEGNTDSTGDQRRNVVLSGQRASAVADYLVEQHGYDRQRFITQGNGASRPACDEATASSVETCRAANRRTEFQLVANPQ